MLNKKLLWLCFILNISLQLRSWAQCGGLTPCSAICLTTSTTFPLNCNSKFTNASNVPPCLDMPSTSENIQYFSFRPSGTTISFVINNGNCMQGFGLQSSILSFVDCSNPSSFAQASGCFNIIPPGASVMVSAVGLIAGQNYLLLIDGYSGDRCDFSINTDPSSLSPATAFTTAIATPNKVNPCKGTYQDFYTLNIFEKYNWSISPASAGTITTPANSSGVNILWDKNFTGSTAKVCLKVKSSCYVVPDACYDVTFNSIPTIHDTLKICSLDLPYNYTIPYLNANPKKIEFTGPTNTVSNKVFNFIDSTNACEGRLELNLTIKPNTTIKGGVLLVGGKDTLHVGTATNYKVVSCVDATGFPLITGNTTPYPDCNGGVEYNVRCVKLSHKTTILLDTSSCIAVSGKILCTATGLPLPSLGVSNGELTYLWSGPSIVGDTTKSSVTFNKYGNYYVTVSYVYSEENKTKTVQTIEKIVIEKGIYNPNEIKTAFFVDTMFYQIPKLVKKVFENDKNITISNVSYKGNATCIGWYDAQKSDLGNSSGIYLNTGDIFQTAQPADVLMGVNNGITGEPDIATALNITSVNDPTVLEMDIESKKDTILTLDYIFASEEYGFMGPPLQDGFVCLVSGPGYVPKTNIALVPNTNLPISTPNINKDTNVSYYKDNAQSTTIAYSGKTVPLQANFSVKKGATYHIKLGIADHSDYIYDSGVFLSISSFGGNAKLRPVPNFTIEQNYQEITVKDSSLYASKWTWDFGDGSPNYVGRTPPYHAYAKTGEYVITLSCENFCCCESISKKIVVNKICNSFPLSLQVVKAPTCVGDADGKITTSLNPNLSYLWSNGSTASTISNLVAGQYTLTATAADGCTQTVTVTLQAPTPIKINVFEVKQPTCSGMPNGYIIVEGNLLGYSYIWNTNAIGEVIFDIGVGTYTVVAKNDQGCRDTLSVTLSAPPGISVGAPKITPDFGQSQGSITLGNITGVSGGGYTVAWSNGATTPNLKNLVAGAYTVTITDVTGCAALQTYTVPLQVSANALEDLGIVVQLNPNPSAMHDPIYLTVKATPAHYNAQYAIFDYTGKKISSQNIALYPAARIPIAIPNQSGVFLLQLQLENGKQQTWRLIRE
jgi:hypothetical protein